MRHISVLCSNLGDSLLVTICNIFLSLAYHDEGGGRHMTKFDQHLCSRIGKDPMAYTYNLDVYTIGARDTSPYMVMGRLGITLSYRVACP